MIPLAEAQARLLALATPLEVETALLPDSIGRYAAEPILALRAQPVRDLSAMDGYAIACASLPGPWRLVGESAAGAPFSGVIGTGDTVRIFTGAALPPGADAVILQEDVLREGAEVRLNPEVETSNPRHVRLKGSDFASGETLIRPGDRITAARVALAIMGGHAALPVRKRPRITLIANGNELVPPGSPLDDAHLPESNSLMLAAMLRDERCDIANPGIIPDDLDWLSTALSHAAHSSDIIVTLGGASVGDHDLVGKALEKSGASMDFWKVAMRPGKPVMAGKLGYAIVLGLPGNPVSAFVTALLFLKPLVAHLGGAADPLPRSFPAILGGDLPATGPRTDHIRAIFAGGRVTPLGQNDSAALKALAASNALIVRLADSPPAEAGDWVTILA
jgi:molybdopterin molybdotransferase